MPEKAKPAVASGGHRKMIVSEWKAHERNTLRGFVSLTLPSGLIIRNVSVHERDGRRWVSMPARPFKRASGSDGWQPLVEFADADARGRFQLAALDAIDRYLESNRE
jgi:DNA-binding cell septation regulator SpoVG